VKSALSNAKSKVSNVASKLKSKAKNGLAKAKGAVGLGKRPSQESFSAMKGWPHSRKRDLVEYA